MMRYHSMSSEREKAYTIEPIRIVFAQNALYLNAFVPEYKEVRTFAVDRIKSLSLTEERFEPVESDEDVFAHSLGVHHGPPEPVEIVFEPKIAPYVRERVWHASQTVRDEADGRVVITLHVSNDFALRSWILGFGALAKVIAPAGLAAEIQEEATRLSARYRARVGLDRLSRSRRLRVHGACGALAACGGHTTRRRHDDNDVFTRATSHDGSSFQFPVPLPNQRLSPSASTPAVPDGVQE